MTMLKNAQKLKTETVGHYKTKREALIGLAWYKEHGHPTKIRKTRYGYSGSYQTQE